MALNLCAIEIIYEFSYIRLIKIIGDGDIRALENPSSIGKRALIFFQNASAVLSVVMNLFCINYCTCVCLLVDQTRQHDAVDPSA